MDGSLIDAVRIVMDEIGAADLPEILAFNKVDQAPEARALAAGHPGSVAISARTGAGMDDLFRAISDRLRAGSETVVLLVPFERGDVLAPAGALIRRLEPDLLTNVFRWTGHFPERTRVLIRYLAERAEQLRQGYIPGREAAATVAVTTLVTGLAMNHVQRGSYLP